MCVAVYVVAHVAVSVAVCTCSMCSDVLTCTGQICLHVCLYLCTHVCAFTYVCMHACTCACMRLCTCVYMHVCMCTHAYSRSDREIDKFALRSLKVQTHQKGHVSWWHIYIRMPIDLQLHCLVMVKTKKKTRTKKRARTHVHTYAYTHTYTHTHTHIHTHRMRCVAMTRRYIIWDQYSEPSTHRIWYMWHPMSYPYTYRQTRTNTSHIGLCLQTVHRSSKMLQAITHRHHVWHDVRHDVCVTYWEEGKHTILCLFCKWTLVR